MTLEFDKCCNFIDLRTRCLIIGYLNLIASIAEILVSILALTAASVITAQGKDDKVQVLGAVMVAVIAIKLVFLILFLAFSIVLLVGLHQHKRGHVKAYLIYKLIFIVLFIIMFFVGLAASHNISADVVFKNLISILLSIYFLLVIRSYYLKMDDPDRKPAVYNKV